MQQEERKQHCFSQEGVCLQGDSLMAFISGKEEAWSTGRECAAGLQGGF